MDQETVHILTPIASMAGAFLASLVRGSKMDPRLRARLHWLTGAVKSLARKASHKLEPEPLEWPGEGTDPGRRL